MCPVIVLPWVRSDPSRRRPGKESTRWPCWQTPVNSSSGSTPQVHAHRRGGRRCHRRGDQQVTVPAAPAGYQQLLKRASQQPGQRVWAIEAPVARCRADLLPPWSGRRESWTGQADRPPPRRQVRRPGSDQAAREALGRDQLAQPRAAGHRALSVRPPPPLWPSNPPLTANANSTRWSLLPPLPCRSRLRDLHASPGQHLREAPAGERLGHRDIAVMASLRALARRLQLLDAEVAAHPRAITVLVRVLAPCGSSPPLGWARSWPRWCCVPGPIRSAPADAAFAMLGGAAPSPPPVVRRSGCG